MAGPSIGVSARHSGRSLSVMLPLVGCLVLTAGTADAAVRVRSADDHAVDRKKAAPPVLSCTPLSLKAELEEGSTAALQFTVANKGGSQLEWLVITPVWIKADVDKGQTGFEETSTVTLEIDASGLKAGPVEGTLTISSSNALGGPITIAVSVLVTARPEPEPSDELEAKPEEAADLAAEEDGPASAVPPVEDEVLPEVTAEPARGGSRAGGRGKMGCHAGIVLPGNADKGEYGTGYLVDLFWRSGDPRSRFAYEFALALGGSETNTGLESNTVAIGSANALMYVSRGERSRIYALTGMSVLHEQVSDDEVDTTSSLGSLLDFGVGGMFGERFDARVKYSMLIGSENIAGLIGMSAGLSF